MSERIVQLNEEIIKEKIKELVRSSVEETLNELLEKETESLPQAPRYERSTVSLATAAATMTGISPPPLVTSRSICRDSRAYPLRLPSSNGISAGRAAGGGPHRDVSGRRRRAPGREHHRGAVGQQGLARHHQ